MRIWRADESEYLEHIGQVLPCVLFKVGNQDLLARGAKGMGPNYSFFVNIK